MTIRLKIILLVLVLELILSSALAFLYTRHNDCYHAKTLSQVEQNLRNGIELEISEVNNRYANLSARFVEMHPDIIEAFAAGNRPALHQRIAPIVERLKRQDPYFESLNFLQADGTVLLRSLRPDRFGDDVRQFPFVAKALESRQPLGGLSIAYRGLAYRISQPVFVDQRFIGAVVFVIRPLRALNMASQIFNVESGIFLENQHCTLIENQTGPAFDEVTLVEHSGKLFEDHNELSKLVNAQNCTSLHFDTRCLLKFSPIILKNFAGVQLGSILPVLDITAEYRNMLSTHHRVLTVAALVIVITLLVLYFGTGVFLSKIEAFQQHLQHKVAQRTQQLEILNQQLTNEIRVREKAQRALMELSEKDPLTELANRRKFNACYQQEWQAGQREQRPLSLLMIDIDFFKNFNDNYGHPAGDKILQIISSVLKDLVLRPRDLVARYGGEEFICLLPDTPSDAATTLAEKLRKTVQALHIKHEFSITDRNMTISVGVATTIPGQADEAQTLLSQADQALYAAKNQGRNQVVCFNQPFSAG
ncbi:MAG: diguanylate cyclase [Desulfuromonadaceae bacterium]|nr:diguanylate cyclase [Desulfuromonadaceae bacterium]